MEELDKVTRDAAMQAITRSWYLECCTRHRRKRAGRSSSSLPTPMAAPRPSLRPKIELPFFLVDAFASCD
jgi:hypothetical protein